MIHPEPRDDARRRHDRLPARARRAARLPAARGRRELQLDLGRRRVLDERRGRAALQRASGQRTAATSVRRRARTPSAPTSRGRSSPTARARPSSPRSASRGAASQDEAKAVARRIATSPLVKTALFGKDANWGRVLAAAGSAPFNGGYAQLDPSLVTLRYNGTKVLDRGAPHGVEPDVDGATCAIDLDLGLGDGARAVPHHRPVLRLRPHQRGLPLVTRRSSSSVGGAVAESAAELILELAEPSRSSSCTAPGRRSAPRWNGAGSRCSSSAAGA